MLKRETVLRLVFLFLGVVLGVLVWFLIGVQQKNLAQRARESDVALIQLVITSHPLVTPLKSEQGGGKQYQDDLLSILLLNGNLHVWADDEEVLSQVCSFGKCETVGGLNKDLEHHIQLLMKETDYYQQLLSKDRSSAYVFGEVLLDQWFRQNQGKGQAFRYLDNR